MNFLRSTKIGIIQLKVSYLTGNRYMDITKWRAVGFSGLKSCLRVPERCYVCHVLISDHKEETNRAKQIVNVLDYSFIVKFVCKINESLS